jgi:RimJ/RimL family protein N-acetyltransferase
MELTVQRASLADLHRIEEIYANARAFMAANGNPTQWNNGYPQKDLLEEDIRLNRLYVVEEENEIKGVFVFFIGADPTYAYIEGSWRSEMPYGVIHRIAGVGGGIFPAALEFCLREIKHMRIDTHENNKPMQHVVEKAGFSRRGIIYVEDGTPRIAYDRI